MGMADGEKGGGEELRGDGKVGMAFLICRNQLYLDLLEMNCVGHTIFAFHRGS
jgi:hypothetical protein